MPFQFTRIFFCFKSIAFKKQNSTKLFGRSEYNGVEITDDNSIRWFFAVSLKSYYIILWPLIRMICCGGSEASDFFYGEIIIVSE